MAIDRSIKRVVARNGQVYFYQRGKRITYKKGIVKFLKAERKQNTGAGGTGISQNYRQRKN
jgi:hypothetical protein